MNVLAFLLAMTWFACFGMAAMTGDFHPLIIWGVAFLLFLGLRGRKVR